MPDVPADPDESLGVAAYFGSLERVKELLASGADANARWGTGTVLMASFEEIDDYYGVRELAVSTALLNSGALVSARDDKGRTALHLAAEVNDTAVRLLLDRGANVDAQDTHLTTPLHVAAARSKAAVVDLLMARGANPDVTDDEGRTPVDLAVAVAAAEQLTSPDHTADDATIETIRLLGKQPHVAVWPLQWLRFTITLEVIVRVAVLVALILASLSLGSIGGFAFIVIPPILLYMVWQFSVLLIEVPLLMKRWPSRRSARVSILGVALIGALRLIWAIWASLDDGQSYRWVFVVIAIMTTTVVISAVTTVVLLRKS